MRGRPPETRMNWVLKFAEMQKSWVSIFDIDHSRGFWETIYFLRKITITICTYRECTDQQHCMYNSIKVKFKFLCDKKVQRKGFYLQVWKIDSILIFCVNSLLFELSKMCLLLKHNVWRYVLLCASRGTTYIKKRLEYDLE